MSKWGRTICVILRSVTKAQVVYLHIDDFADACPFFALEQAYKPPGKRPQHSPRHCLTF